MSEIAFDIIKESLPSLTEDEGLTVFWELQRKFGWSGTVFTRADAEQEWQNAQYDETTGLTFDDPMPDEVWDLVVGSWEWRKGIPEMLCERGWPLVFDAVFNAVHNDLSPE